MMRLALATLAVLLPVCAADATEFEFHHEFHHGCIHAAPTFAFDASDAPPQYGRGRAFDVKHIKLEVELDFEAESLTGVATHTLRPIGKAATEVEFDAVNMDIQSVMAGNTALDFEVTNDKLRVYFDKPVPENTETTVAIQYATTRPEAGLYFRTERLGYTSAETQAWTQGQPEDARHWFPCIDYPNERASTEMICTVRDDFVALSNGNLVGTTHDPSSKQKTFHWRQRQEHVTYLVTLVAGPFVSVQDRAGGIPLFYYCLPGEEGDAQKTYMNTPAMMKIFEEKIGLPYPYDRYSQVSVIDFVAGGMENTAITTMTERIILDDSARLTRSMDGLIAHELAHQWFGDLFTCRDWSHLWLNEGFATYLEAIYLEHQFGRDAMIHDMLANQRSVVRLDGGEGKKPVVSQRYASADGVFGYRPYAKGASVLHMMRNELGDDLFWEAIQAYVKRYTNQVVETNDLMRTVESVSGKSMEQFFDQWLYHTGYPKLTVTYDWNEGQKLANVNVRQTQKVTAATPLFAFSTTLEFHGENGVHSEPVTIDGEYHTFFVELEERPDFVRIDPESFIVKKLTFDKPKPMLLAQLKRDPSISGKYQACEQLSKKKGADVVAALRDALENDAFWGVRAKAAEALGGMDNEQALEALLANATTDESRVRLAVIDALATNDDPRARRTLIERVEEDPASYVVAEAISGLGNQRAADAIPSVTAALRRDSHSQVVRNAALNALAKLRPEGGLNAIVPYTKPGAPRQSRRTALSAVGNVGEFMEDKSRAREALTAALGDPHPSRRTWAIRALVNLGDVRAIGALEKLAATTKIEDEAKRARDAIQDLRAAEGTTQEVKSLRKEVDSLNDAREKLEERLQSLEERVKHSENESNDSDGA